MNEKNIWNNFREIEKEYFICIANLLNDPNKISLFQNAFQNNAKLSVLRLLDTLTYPKELQILKQLFSELLTTALLGNEFEIGLSRKIISHIDRSWLNINIPKAWKLIEFSKDDEEWFYRRTAELYKHLELGKLLFEHLEVCKRNPSPEINEIAIDFSNANF